MSGTVLRGRLLDFHGDPAEDAAAHRYVEDGALWLRDGTIAASGGYAEVAARAGDAPVVDHRPGLLLPGFVDAHLHFPQLQVVGSWAAELLDWLEDYTFPAEGRFADAQHARAMARRFCDMLTLHGTTTAAVFCSSHRASAEALFAEARARDMRIVAGQTMMDRGAPAPVLDTAQSAHDDAEALIAAWHGTGRCGYAITPRFAITSTPAQLEAAGALAAAHPDCHVQTHLSENRAEIELTARLYPEARDYLDIYEGYGLVGPRTLLGHAIHLEAREIDALAERGAHPVFCPTSNLFLGSGLFDEAGLRARGIESGVATDIGGGTSWSMLETLAEGYKVLQLRGQRFTAMQSFHWITRGNARVLGMEDRIGTLAEGTEADVTVLDARATPAMALRMERVETLEEELFVLQTMGDDRAVAECYVAGVARKGGA